MSGEQKWAAACLIFLAFVLGISLGGVVATQLGWIDRSEICSER